ncbi:glutamate receptor 1-like isoform X2 [Brevipalpus obovatus]|uniref:glutamate receptor 1-like isoform X2 n=1 Tax=Brevipalpus obovatus TaxID=246614 RepID=UPI003D9EFA66
MTSLELVITSSFVLSIILFTRVSTLPERIPIGSILPRSHRQLQEAIELALLLHNSNEFQSKFKIDHVINIIDQDDPFSVTQELCLLLNKGVFAIVVPTMDSSFETIASYSNTFQMPFLHLGSTSLTSSASSAFQIALRPHYFSAIVDIIKLYQWKEIIYLYTTDDGLGKLQYIFSLINDNYTLDLRAVRRIKNSSDAHAFLKAMEMSDPESRKYIVLDCDVETAKDIIVTHVRDIYMGRRNFHFLLTRLVEEALIIDGVSVILDTFSRLLRKRPDIFRNNFRRGEVYNNGSRGIDCKRHPPISFEHGKEIYRYMQKTRIIGLTGNISFDDRGFRRDFRMDIVKMSINTVMTKIANWSPKEGMQVMPDKYERKPSEPIANKTFRVTSILDEPFLMLKNKGREYDPRAGNEQFEGYCKDLADLIAQEMEISYEMRLVSDNKFGGKSNNASSWNGMVGELIRQEADIAIAPLTITADRERVIDFTKPFMSVGISIMIKKPAKQNPGIFSFMNPLSTEIWVLILLSYLGVSIVLFLVSRFSPHEWRYEDTLTGPAVTNDFDLQNSLWFSLGAVVRQSCDVSPRSISGRIVGGVWWFFTLIIISSYTANLAAFLTVERMVTPINSAEDLSRQTDVEYGLLRDSSTQEFFKRSNIDVYKRMWDYMRQRTHLLVDSYKQGIQRVRDSKGKYAFLIESTQNDYTNERQPCDTMKIGRHIDSKGYGVGTPLNSPLRVRLNLEILNLKENGILQKLENKWWYDRSECKSKDGKESAHSELTLGNVAGCFYILIGGLLLGLVVALIEFFWTSKREAVRKQVGFLQAMRTNAHISITGAPYFERMLNKGN